MGSRSEVRMNDKKIQESVSQVTDRLLWQQTRVPQHQRSASFPSVNFTHVLFPGKVEPGLSLPVSVPLLA